LFVALNESARMPHGISPTGVAFGWVTICLAMVLGYAVPRYGLSDRMTQLAATLALAVGVCFRWVPGVVPACVALATAAVACGAAMSEGRRALAALTASLAAMAVWWRLRLALPGPFSEVPQWVRNAGYLLFVGTVVWFPVLTASRVSALLERRARRRTAA
jgi:hypothetical protein